ncbi:MAG TPA: hypothetical protein VGP72_22955 [Planctomycetota bacterium]|jgi:hypothetical protein
MKTNLDVLWDGEEVERLRKVRRAIERRYKTFEGLCAHLERLESRAGKAKTVSSKKNKSRAASSRKSPAHPRA